MTKEEIKLKEKELHDLTGQFCAKYLNDEYFELCEKLIQKLARKRDVPFKRGKAEIWAAAVIYTIGSINFLYDKSFQAGSLNVHRMQAKCYYNHGKI
jgi:hypothetical protein